MSGTFTTNGSYVTGANPAYLELVAADLTAAMVGVGYDIEANVVDHNDGDRTKLAEQGTLMVLPALGGNVG